MKKALIFAVLTFTTACLSRADWTQVTPLSVTNDLKAVAFGAGKYVAGGSGVLIYSEDDGATWKLGTKTGTVNVRAIAFGNDKFVAVGSGSQVYHSANGATWQVANVVDDGFETLTFGNGVFVATSVTGTIAYSTTATQWTSLGRMSPNALYVAFGNGAFLAQSHELSSTTMTVLRSSNGASWTTNVVAIPAPKPADYTACPPFPQQPCIPVYSVRSLAFGNGIFATGVSYAGPAQPYIKFLTSSDGQAWQWVAPGGDKELPRPWGMPPENPALFINGRFVDLNQYGVADASANLSAWTTIFFPVWVEDLAANGSSSIVGVGAAGGIVRGAALENMVRVGEPGLTKITSVAANGARLIAVGPSATLGLSVDGGKTWTKQQLPADAGDVESVEYGGGYFVAVGTGGTAIRSVQGDTWAKRLSNTTSDLHDLVFGNNLWVAVGNNGTVITSPDASFFSLQNSQTQVRLNSVTFGNGQYVAVGADGAVLNSSNGTAWTARGTDEAVTLNGVAFGNGPFVAVGNAGTTHWTTDLATWHTVKIGGAGNLADVAFANGVFAAIEEGTDRVFTSVEGEIWTLQSLEGSLNFGVDSTDGRLFVTGDRGVIWAYVQSPNIVLGGGKDAQDQFKLIISAPVAGTYRVYSTTDVTGSVWTPRDLVSVSGQATWTDPNPMAAPTFYEVRKE